MGKVSGSRNKTDTKLLYKKSNITIRTHSRSCSDASEVTKSSLLQIQKNFSKSTDYYKDGDKIKRDLSIETGACILRRYYKSKGKRNKSSVPPSTAKSKCSTIVDEFADFKPDHASGDSTNKFEVEAIKNLNIDITSMMVQNLKHLLNDWIRQHVLEDSDTKKKILNVLDSILKSLEHTKVSSTHSSCSTYIVERNGGYRVRDRKTETKSLTCQYCKHKQTLLITEQSSSVLLRKYSRFTIPLPYKHLKMISTLSIPRDFHKKEKCRRKHLVYKVKKKDMAINNHKKEKKVVINISSCCLAGISKENFRKDHEKRQTKKKGVLFIPRMFYKSTTDCSSTTEVIKEKRNKKEQEDQLDTVPSLVKSIYADDPANITSTDKVKNNENRNDNFTMTDINALRINSTTLLNSKPNVRYHEAKLECCKHASPIPNDKKDESRTNIDFISQSDEFPNLKAQKDKPSKIHSNKTCSGILKPKSQKKQVKLSRRVKYSSRFITPRTNKRYKDESIRYKHFNYLYKKAKLRNFHENDFLNDFRNVLKYFSSYKGNQNIKLEIHCNVYPFFEVENKNSKADIPQEYEIKVVPTKVCNVIPETGMSSLESTVKNKDTVVSELPKLKAEIIPILDGSASQAKYIFKSENSTSISENSLKCNYCTETGTAMTGLEVTKELKDLKSAIRDLSATAGKIVSEHLKRQHEKIIDSTATYSKPVQPHLTKLLNDSDRQTGRLSKGIQFSSIGGKGQLSFGIKLSKGPKRTENYSHKMKKKSSSYHVIDSEAILKVTDMTASGNKSKDSKLTPGVIQKSKSLLNITNDANKQKLIAFFCNTNASKNKNDRLVYRFHPGPGNVNDPAFDAPAPPNTPYFPPPSSPNKILLPVNISDYKGCEHDYCSSCYVDIDKPAIIVKKRSGMPWWEGLIYCLLLWIPVIVICYFFYDLVIKELNKTEKPQTKTRMGIEAAPDQWNVSRFLLKLSDFGF